MLRVCWIVEKTAQMNAEAQCEMLEKMPRANFVTLIRRVRQTMRKKQQIQHPSLTNLSDDRWAEQL